MSATAIEHDCAKYKEPTARFDEDEVCRIRRFGGPVRANRESAPPEYAMKICQKCSWQFWRSVNKKYQVICGSCMTATYRIERTCSTCNRTFVGFATKCPPCYRTIQVWDCLTCGKRRRTTDAHVQCQPCYRQNKKKAMP